jgi:AraC-like DNA-binding protein
VSLAQDRSLWSFSTRGMAPALHAPAFGALRELGVLPFEPLADHAPEAEIVMRRFGEIGVVMGTLGGLRQVVPPKANEFSGDVFLGVNISGLAIARHRGQEHVMQNGAGVLFSDVETGFTSTRPRSSRFLGLRLPRRKLSSLVPHLDRSSMHVITGESASLRLLVEYLRCLSAPIAQGSSGVDRAVGAHILDLIALSLGQSPESSAASGGGLRAARVQAIKAEVAKNFSNADFSIATVAARLNVTPRYIHKLFEPEPQTFSGYVLAERLAFVHRLLSDRHLVDRSVTSIALDAGFSDLSYFNRSFRRRFHATPTEVRRQAFRD